MTDEALISFLPEQSVGFVFWQTCLMWQRKTIQALKPLDLTHVQFILLAAIGRLSEQHDEVTQIMVAKHVNTDVMMTSKALRTLEKKQLITRMEHSSDTRAKTLNLTARGEQQLQHALKLIENVDDVVFKTLGLERQTFMNTLNNIIDSNQSKPYDLIGD